MHPARILSILWLAAVLSACGAAEVTPESALAAFEAAGLPVSNVTTDDVLPGLVADMLTSCRGARFDVEGDEGARVIRCEELNQAEGLGGYYESLGQSNALFFSHVHRDGKIVFQMNGELSVEQFESYVAALP